MGMPLLAACGLLAGSTLGFLCSCDASPRAAEVQAGTSAAGTSSPETKVLSGEVAGEILVSKVGERARHIAQEVDLSWQQHLELLNILLHAEDRLDAAREAENDPRMREALEDHRLEVTEWTARRIRRVLGEVVAMKIVASYESEEAGRVITAPASAPMDR